jgi:UDP-N-acetylmuramyl tripeptide synthase
VKAGSTYLIQLSIQAKAANLNDTSQLLMQLTAKGLAGGSITQVVLVPAHGVNSKGEVVQTTQLFGLFQPKADNENLNVVVVEKNGKKLYALSGVVELTKAKVQIIGSTPTQGNVTVSQSVAKAAVAKAAVAKKPTPKKP